MALIGGRVTCTIPGGIRKQHGRITLIEGQLLFSSSSKNLAFINSVSAVFYYQECLIFYAESAHRPISHLSFNFLSTPVVAASYVNYDSNSGHSSLPVLRDFMAVNMSISCGSQSVAPEVASCLWKSWTSISFSYPTCPTVCGSPWILPPISSGRMRLLHLWTPLILSRPWLLEIYGCLGDWHVG